VDFANVNSPIPGFTAKLSPIGMVSLNMVFSIPQYNFIQGLPVVENTGYAHIGRHNFKNIFSFSAKFLGIHCMLQLCYTVHQR
jgi:hypothetical protein